jgi:hypothetical protein
MEGEKMRSHQKGFLKLKCLSHLKMLTSPLFEETFGVFLSFFFSFFSAPSLLEKLLLKWLQYTGGGRIFQSGVMHTNMAKT